MHTEIEAKLKVDSLEEVEQTLARLGARFIAEQIQTDHHFDDARATLSKKGSALRLRREQVGRATRLFLTYKGPQQKSSFKERREIEVEVKQGPQLETLLAELGYKRTITVEKTRRLWQLDQCRVALDRLPMLGQFVEIEGPDDKTIESAQKNLGLETLQHIPTSYAALTRAKLAELDREKQEKPV